MPAETVVRDLYARRASAKRDTREYERAWRVWTHDSGVLIPMEAAAVLTAVWALHPLGAAFPGLAGVEHDETTPESDRNCEVWTVTGRYRIPEVAPVPEDFDDFMEKSSQERTSDNPHGAKHSGGSMIVEEYDYKDLDGKWFLNSAGDPLEHLLPTPVPIQIDRVTLNMETYPLADHVGTANGHRLYAGNTYDSAEHKNPVTGKRTPYYVVTFETWWHTKRKWVPTIIWDAGYNELYDDKGQIKKRPIMDPKTGQPYNVIQLLNGAGRRLPANNKNPHPLEFRVREEGELGIPFFN